MYLFMSCDIHINDNKSNASPKDFTMAFTTDYPAFELKYNFKKYGQMGEYIRTTQ